MAEGGALSAEQLAEQLAALKVEDFLVSSASTLVAIAFGKLDVGKPEEARLAIEALRALLPVLEPAVAEQTRRDLQQALANLQLAYAAAVSAPQGQEPATNSAAEDDDPSAPAAGPDEPDSD